MIYTITEGILWYSLVFVILLVIKLVNDYVAKNYQHRIINHGFSVFIDIIVLAGASSYIFNSSLLLSNWIVVGMIFIALSLRWILFDMAFNLMNGDKLMHVGESSDIDKIMSKYEPLTRLWIKLGVLALFVCITVLVYGKTI